MTEIVLMVPTGLTATHQFLQNRPAECTLTQPKLAETVTPQIWLCCTCKFIPASKDSGYSGRVYELMNEVVHMHTHSLLLVMGTQLNKIIVVLCSKYSSPTSLLSLFLLLYLLIFFILQS